LEASQAVRVAAKRPIRRRRLESSPIPVKYMLKRLGVLKANEHRLPLVPASPDVEKQLDKVLADLGMV
jgi:4-hydroxy-tetrahydrodipicolinate synthase